MLLTDTRCTSDIVNQKGDGNMSALFYALEKSDLTIIQLLMDFPGIEVNNRNDRGECPILYATGKRHEAVRLFLSNPTTVLDSVLYGTEEDVVNIACSQNSVEMLQMFIEDKRWDPEMINRTPRLGHNDSALSTAAKEGFTDIMKILLNQPGVNINIRDNWRYTPLFHAVERDHPEIVKLLLDKSIVEDENSLKGNINNDDFQDGNHTLLTLAAEKGNPDIMRMLLDYPGIDVNFKTYKGLIPLTQAMKYNKPMIVEMLLSREDTRLDLIDDENESALHYACSSSYVECVRLFLKDKRCTEIIVNHNISSRHVWPSAPLLCGAYEGNMEIVKMLLEFPGIDLNVIWEDHGYTPLLTALFCGHNEVAKLLLANKNTDIAVTDKENKSALMIACIHEKSVESFKLLLSHENCPNDFINHKDKNNYSALSHAANYANEEMVKELLLEPGIDVNVVNNYGNSLLYCAMERNWVEVLKLLLANNNLKLEILSEKAGNPLFAAVEENNIECVHLFLQDKRCTANILNQWVGGALLEAVDMRSPVMVRLLIDNPTCDINIPDYKGVTPLMHAMGPGVAKGDDICDAKKDDTTIVHLLLAEARTKLDLIDKYHGRNALSFGFLSNHLEAIKLFTSDARCTPDLLNNTMIEDDTLLMRAVKDGNEEMVKILASLEDIDCNAGNPLSYALKRNQPNILSILLTNQTIKLDIGTDLITACLHQFNECIRHLTKDTRCTTEILNRKNQFGETALMTAVVYGNTEIVEYLVDLQGIDLEAENDAGKNVKDLAEKQYGKRYVNIFKNK